MMLAMPAEGRQINGAIGSRVGAGMQATPLYPNIHDDSPSVLMMDSGFFDLNKEKVGKKSEKPQAKKAPAKAEKRVDHGADLPHHLWFS
jgi:hypothetical protein